MSDFWKKNFLKISVYFMLLGSEMSGIFYEISAI